MGTLKINSIRERRKNISCYLLMSDQNSHLSIACLFLMNKKRCITYICDILQINST